MFFVPVEPDGADFGSLCVLAGAPVRDTRSTALVFALLFCWRRLQDL